jgi:hypothetical protein
VISSKMNRLLLHQEIKSEETQQESQDSSSEIPPIPPVVSKLPNFSPAGNNSTVKYGHDSEVTSQVLLHLLANSLTHMQLDNAHVHVWMD